MPPILFIHGLFQTIADEPHGWTCPDLPGYGRSIEIEPATLPVAAEFVGNQIVEPAHIVGHSIGGAIAVLLATSHPELVASIVNVEGNFTLKDAFWSSRLAAMTPDEADAELDQLRQDPARWLTNARVPINPATLQLAERSLAAPTRTVQSMAHSVVEITSRPDYLDAVSKIHPPVHLIAGEHSRDEWDVPQFVLERAASFQIQQNAGHMLMMGGLPQFVELVERAVFGGRLRNSS